MTHDEPKAGSEIPKPCPFCGVHVPRLQDPHTGFIDSSWMEHPKQTIEGLMCPVAGKKAYIPYWNTRAEDSALRAENAELRARVESDLMQQNATAKTLRAELAQAKEEIAKLKRVEECPACRDGVPHSQTPLCHIGPATTCGDGSTRIPEAVLASEKAAKERAEARVKRLAGIMEARGIHKECGGVKSGTGVVLCNCARAKEGEKR